MSISASFTVEFPDFSLAVDISLAAGEVLAVLGPNGSGKSTLAHSLAGLQPITTGRIEVCSTVVDDAEHSIFVLPEHRHVGVMFQAGSLFNNFSVLDNVAFGLRSRGMRKNEARNEAHQWLERFSLDAFAQRGPSTLSGGQAQRVALARALATKPSLLILDEPTSALDIRSKAEIRRDLQRLQHEQPVATVLITHDSLDAFALATRVLVLETGRVVQSGSLDEVASHPQSRHIADMVGLSLVRGIVSEGRLTTASGAQLVVPADTAAGRSIASIRPSAVSLHQAKPEGSPRNSWSVIVTDLDRHPERVRVRLQGPIPLLAELTPEGAEALDLKIGGILWASVKASEVAVTPDLAL
ncbi:MAG: ABC transporter ATP-binding protein [Acidimicrobiales bacterium]